MTRVACILLSRYSFTHRTSVSLSVDITVFKSLAGMCVDTFRTSFSNNFKQLEVALIPLMLYISFVFDNNCYVVLEKRRDFCFSIFPTYVISEYQ